MEHNFVLDNLKFVKEILASPNQYQLNNETVVVSIDKEKKYKIVREDNIVNNDKYYIKDRGTGSGYFLYKGRACVDNISNKDKIVITQINPDSSATQNGTFYYLVKSDTTGGRKKNKTRKSKKHKKSKKYKKSKSRRSRKYKK